MATSRVELRFFLSVILALLSLCLLGCSSQEAPKEAAKEKPAVAAPATPAAPVKEAAAPKTADGYINQGKEALKIKQFDQPILAFDETIKLDPKSVQAYNNRGSRFAIRMIMFKPSMISPGRRDRPQVQ